MSRTLALALCLMCALPAFATTYRLATAADGGSDANTGLDAAHPWLSPNHALNCGDVIIAKASTTYAAANFASGKWGTVTCAGGNNVAWLMCETFDGCKIAATNVFAMWISKSYWGVQGWEVSGTGDGGVCYGVVPVGGATIHHIILANNICNGGANGFSISPQSITAGVDYVNIVGNIVYNSSLSTTFGNSGVTIYEPVKSDSAAGTHIYVAGNFTFDVVSHNAGSYDGNGIALDDLGWAQGGGTAYNQQVAVEDNLSVWNGSFGLVNSGNGTPNAPIYWEHNTSTHNQTASNLLTTTCGDTATLTSALTTITANLIATTADKACLSTLQTWYAVAMNAGTATDTVAGNWLYSATGNNVGIYSNNGFAAGSNTTGTDPSFASQADPGAPNCTGKVNTVDCMSAVIANYKPANVSAQSYGYRDPRTTQLKAFGDALFPAWLCSVTNLPSGLIPKTCATTAIFTGVLTSNADSLGIVAAPARKQLTNCATGYSGGALQPAGVPVGQLYCTAAAKTAGEAAGGPVQGFVAATATGTGIAVVDNGQNAGGTDSPSAITSTYGGSGDDAVCTGDPNNGLPTIISGLPPATCVANSSAVFSQTSAIGFAFPNTLWPSDYASNSTTLDSVCCYYRDTYFQVPVVAPTYALEMDVNVNSSPTAYAAGSGAYFGWGFQYNHNTQTFQFCPQGCGAWVSLRGIAAGHADLTTYALTDAHWYHIRLYGHRMPGCTFTSPVNCFFYDYLTVNDVTAAVAPITYKLVNAATGAEAGGIPVDKHTWAAGPDMQVQIDTTTANATASAHIVSDTTTLYVGSTSGSAGAFWF